MNEEQGEIGSDFSMDNTKAWEKIFFETTTLKILKTALKLRLS
jgi:hypothetical protein